MKKIMLSIFWILCLSCQEPEPEILARPNILFIEVDDLTSKYLGLNGADFASTPNLDKLASTGVVFENAVVQGTMCTPSRNSLITSMYSHNLNLFENLDLKSLPKNTWTFPKALQKEGYYTTWVGKNHLLPTKVVKGGINPIQFRTKRVAIEMGFDDVYQTLGRSMILDLAKRKLKNDNCWEEGDDAYGDFLFQNNLLETFVAEGYVTPTVLDPDTEIMDGHFTSIAIEKMKNYTEDKPFFMWVNFSGPHLPFNVPKEYWQKVSAKKMPMPIDTLQDTFEVPKELKTYDMVNKNIHIPSFRHGYSASISYMDAQVGRLVDFIRNSDLNDNTIIFFFSDHGIMTGDHGLIGKYTLYKEVLDPSLIVSYPKEFEPQRVLTAVELLDLGKTVLDIAGATNESLNQVPNGNSLLPILKSEKSYAGDGIGFSEIRTMQSVFDGTYKYISHPETPILFNLAVNPDETQNFIDQNPEVAKTLKKVLEQRMLNSKSGLEKVAE